MKYLIVSRQNGFGLDHDIRVLKGALEELGIEVAVAKPRDRRLFDRLRGTKSFERIIHVERVHRAWLGAADEHFVVPNQERFPKRHLHLLTRMNAVLAKTLEAQSTFGDLGLHTVLLGFTTEDCLDHRVEKDWSACLHVAGRSTMKGTEDLIAVWGRHPEWPNLTVVQDPSRPWVETAHNVRLIRQYMEPADLKVLQSQCGVHLCPSRSEGWGHYISEAMSCGSVLITTDAPPMNEIADASCAVMVPYSHTEPRHFGTCYYVDQSDLENAIGYALSLTMKERSHLGESARVRFEKNDRRFRETVRKIFSR